MWYEYDSESRRRISEDRWNDIRRNAAQHRLLPERRDGLDALLIVRRAVSWLEQTFSPHAPSMPEMEVERVVSLLAPDGSVLRVEQIDIDSDEDECCSPIA